MAAFENLWVNLNFGNCFVPVMPKYIRF